MTRKELIDDGILIGTNEAVTKSFDDPRLLFLKFR